MATLTYKVLTFNQLPYLSHLTTLCTSARILRLLDKHLLPEPAVSTVTRRRGFSYAASSIRNEIFLTNLQSLFVCFQRPA